MSDLVFRVHLILTSTAEGGRRNAIRSGYRCQFWIGGMTGTERVYNDAMIELVDREQLAPGEDSAARVRPGVPPSWQHVVPGAKLELYEGSKRVGIATVQDRMVLS